MVSAQSSSSVPKSNQLPEKHFPDRKTKEPEKSEQDKESWSWKVWNFISQEENWKKNQRLKSERAVYEALQKPMPRLLINAIRASGCGFEMSRNISVEECSDPITSGYDPINKQIVVSKTATGLSTDKLAISLTAELIQMFDQCRAKTDFSDIHHFACSQIRAVAQTRCKTRTSAAFETGEFWQKGEHETCVKVQALAELGLLRPQLDKISLWDAVEKVFVPCYNDREPFGRIVRIDSEEPKLIWAQRRNYGYY